MKGKLLTTVALAILGLAVGAGAASSQTEGGGLVASGSSGVAVDLPGGDNLPPVESLPACSNLKDDDGDGTIDLADPGCSGPLDGDEYNAPPPPPPPDGGGGGGTGGGGGDTGGGGTGTSDGTSYGSGGEAGPDGVGGSGSGPGAGGSGSGGGGSSGKGGSSSDRKPMQEPATRSPDGTPTKANPTVTIADFGPAPIGVPSFIIDQFTIPPFLLPIYQACGTQYGIPWEVLAGINRIETAFGTNLNVSTAGAVGWMQFLPSTWKGYGVDANGDGRKDPYNPVDAICAAARYLRAAGGETDLRQAIFAYNHADWYVDEVLLYAHQYGRLPADLVGSLTGLTEGDRFPVAANARYADDLSERAAAKRAKPTQGSSGNVADVVSSSPTRRGINIYSHEGAPVVAVNDGVIKQMGHSEKLGNFVVLKDSYGNRFTYAQLGRISRVYPVPKQHKLNASDFRLVSPKRDKAPDTPASAGAERKPAKSGGGQPAPAAKAESGGGPVNTEDLRPRLYALPERPHNVDRAGLSGQLDNLLSKKVPGYETVKRYLGGMLHFNQQTMQLRPLKKGSSVVAGTVLGRVGKTDQLAPHLNFSIRPAGRGAPRIDPKPILDGWKLLEATAIYRAAGENPFQTQSVSQILLMSKTELERRVLADPRLSIYECGRNDIRTGQIDERILAAMEYLVSRGYRLTITSLKCGHSFLTTSGNVSEHSTGDAMDIAQVNGIPIIGNQGPGTITDAVIRDLLQLQGTMQPHQIISLENLGGPSFAMADHNDHIHVGYMPQGSESNLSKQFESILKPDQWKQLVGRIAEIDNPTVPTKPSKFAIPTQGGQRASGAHTGE
jgi:murein DD-endopeptidase MepM/ murein hydrolase activator NlpD